MTTPQDSTSITPGGRWLYPLLLSMQPIGVVIFYWQGIPLYRQASASPFAYESQPGARIWALLAIAITQVGYWVRYQTRPALPHLANAVLGHVVLFWSRLSFTLPTSVFSFVFIANRATRGILGCHVVGERAVEIAQVAAIAMAANMKVDDLAQVPLSFPTYAAILARVAASVTHELDLGVNWHGNHQQDSFASSVGNKAS
jgi:Pyridine nucleotide-disulphide oxidoreductase, dimerisation domain